MNSELLVDDDISENSRTIVIDIEKEKLMEALYAHSESLSRVQYTVSESVMLCSEDFLQTVDIYPVSEEGLDSEPKSFDDYFSSGTEETEPNEKKYTSVIVAPYTSMPSLSEDTGRNYLAEKDLALEFVLSVAEQAVGQKKLSV